MLTEESAIAQITVLESGTLQIKREDRVLRDGVVISTQNHRWTLNPGDILEGQDPRVAAVATATWTPENVAVWADAFVAMQAAERARCEQATAEMDTARLDMLAAREALLAERELADTTLPAA